MVEEIATVVATAPGGVWLTTTPVGTCNACQVSSDCGTGIVTKALTPRQSRFFLATDLPLLAGEQVRIGVAEQHLVTAALMVYLLPLLLLVGAALSASVAGLAEIWLILLSAVAAGLGFVIARRYDQRQHSAQPIHILAVLPALKVNQA
ncbi:MAG: SoxR reducing system RseC family protein [Gammaproteobacteria bacterium]|uniref:SoxR reducing system RseC family protein n=1 Tax=Rheinheimera sp. TaxID=1869214 RepID=UPI004048CE7E|nr:SoxR reducing system RseC family protein [Gammaproteobacteria bacterium]